MAGPTTNERLGQVNSPEAGLTAHDFPTRIGQALSIWAERHSTPDTQIEFIGHGGRKTFTPKGLAEEVVNQTPFGLEMIEYYLDVSKNLGDETGERVIQDLVHGWKTGK